MEMVIHVLLEIFQNCPELSIKETPFDDHDGYALSYDFLIANKHSLLLMGFHD
jgi:hypothetical protein